VFVVFTTYAAVLAGVKEHGMIGGNDPAIIRNVTVKWILNYVTSSLQQYGNSSLKSMQLFL
jgi:hypothetical protein